MAKKSITALLKKKDDSIAELKAKLKAEQEERKKLEEQQIQEIGKLYLDLLKARGTELDYDRIISGLEEEIKAIKQG